MTDSKSMTDKEMAEIHVKAVTAEPRKSYQTGE